MKVIKVIVDKMPNGCQSCLFASLVDCTLTGDLFGKYIDKKKYSCWRPDWCPLVRAICPRCYGTGTILLSVDADPIPCPDCGGHCVEHRKHIRYESEE